MSGNSPIEDFLDEMRKQLQTDNLDEFAEPVSSVICDKPEHQHETRKEARECRTV